MSTSQGMLAPADEAGLSLRELAAKGFEETAHRQEALATGETSTVAYAIRFSFMLRNRIATRPRFMAQLPLLPKETMCLGRKDDECSPVELAIRQALRQ
jgi:hypothetical protein